MITFSAKGKNPFYAIGCLFKGLKYLTKPQLRKFLLIPVCINLLLYGIAFAVAFFYMDSVIEYLLPEWLKTTTWLSWLTTVIGWLFFACFFMISFFTFTILANLIASPFYDKLSARTLELLIINNTPEDEEPKLPEPPADIPLKQTLYSEWLRLRYFLGWMLIIVIISLIPVINIIAPILWGLFGAWAMALEYLTYPLENKGLLFNEQKRLAKSVRTGVLGMGGLTVLGLMIPLVNIFVPPAAVIGATLYTHGVVEDEDEKTETEIAD